MEALNLIATLIAIGSAAVTAAIWGWHRRPTSWGRPTLIFVSMGGTCRDPIAKAITDNLLAQKKPRIVVKAAGILKGHTRGASPAARNVVRERLGIDALKGHRSKKLTGMMISRANLILTMSTDNKRQILKVNPECSNKVYTLKEFFGFRGEIKNPYIFDDQLSDGAIIRYRNCYDEIEKLLAKPGNIEKIYNAVRA